MTRPSLWPARGGVPLATFLFFLHTIPDLIHRFESDLSEIGPREVTLYRGEPRPEFEVRSPEGGLRIDDFNEFFPVHLPDGDYETIGGLLLDRLGRIPVRGERIAVGDIRIEVSAASPRRVLRVRVTLPAVTEGARRGHR